MKYRNIICSIFYFLLLIVAFATCKEVKKETPKAATESNDSQAPNLAISIDGRMLKPWNDTPENLLSQEARINEGRNNYLKKNNDIEPYISYVRDFLKAGKIEHAIKICDKGFEKFPAQTDLLVLRAEAQLKGRQLQSAIDDCWDAGKSLESKGNYMGLVKQTGKDSIFNGSVAYKNYLTLSVAMQTKNDLSNAEKMYEIVSDFCTNPDLYTQTHYFQYQCYARATKKEEAKKLLANVEKTKSVLAPAKPYLQSLVFWKGELTEAELVYLNVIPTTHDLAEDWIIKAYAVAVKQMLMNQTDAAKATLTKIVTTGFWDYYPYILAEKDLAQLGGIVYKEPEHVNLNSNSKVNIKQKKK